MRQGIREESGSGCELLENMLASPGSVSQAGEYLQYHIIHTHKACAHLVSSLFFAGGDRANCFNPGNNSCMQAGPFLMILISVTMQTTFCRSEDI